MYILVIFSHKEHQRMRVVVCHRVGLYSRPKQIFGFFSFFFQEPKRGAKAGPLLVKQPLKKKKKGACAFELSEGEQVGK